MRAHATKKANKIEMDTLSRTSRAPNAIKMRKFKLKYAITMVHICNLKICTVYPCTRRIMDRHMIILLLAVLAPSNRKCDFIGETSTFLTSLKLPRFEATTVCCEWRIKCHHEYGSYKVVFDVQKHSIIIDSSSV
eukprot:1018691_1